MPITRARLGLQPRPAAKSGTDRCAGFQRRAISILHRYGVSDFPLRTRVKSQKIGEIIFKWYLCSSLWFQPRSSLPALPHRLLAALGPMGSLRFERVRNQQGERRMRPYIIENIIINPMVDFLRYIFRMAKMLIPVDVGSVWASGPTLRRPPPRSLTRTHGLRPPWF